MREYAHYTGNGPVMTWLYGIIEKCVEEHAGNGCPAPEERVTEREEFAYLLQKEAYGLLAGLNQEDRKILSMRYGMGR